jgi:hypothetical protein
LFTEDTDLAACPSQISITRRYLAATLRQLCEHVEVHLGPFGVDPVNLMSAVHGHLHPVLRRGGVLLDPTERPPRQLEATAAP